MYNIRPRIEGLTIYPVDIDTDPNAVVYVVEIPESTTAHQVTASKDYRYYKRYNFESVPMENYEIRLVMNRFNLPSAVVEFSYRTDRRENQKHEYILEITIENQSTVVINHLKLEFIFPHLLSPEGLIGQYKEHIVKMTNKYGDHVIIYHSKGVLFPKEKLNITDEVAWRYYVDNSIYRKMQEAIRAGKEISLTWTLFADNMPVKQGKKPFSELNNF